MAGVIDPQTARVISASNAMPGWSGQHPGQRLAHLGVKVAARNDVHAALLGEQWRGGLRGARRGALLTLGSGLGGAWMVEGRLQTGAHEIAGHVGRQRIEHAGRAWFVDELVSGNGLAQLHHLAGGTARNGHQVLAALRTGDKAAEHALAQWTQLLARVLHNLHWLLDPGRVLLGGGLIDAREHWWPQLMQSTQELPLRIEPARLGARAGLLGAACLAWEAA
jgi:glucokinase